MGEGSGRQRGIRNLALDIRRSLEIPVTLSDKGRPRRVSTQEALILRLREKALKGDNRALETLLSLARTHNGDEARDCLGDETVALDDQAILEAFAEDMRSRPAPGAEDMADAPQSEEAGGDE